MILLTGASGFLGKNIYHELGYLGIKTLGRSTNSDVRCDLTCEVPSLANFNCIIHAAGKAHIIPKTQEEIKSFYDVNVTGTRNLLLALEQMPCLPEFFVFISTVAVYGMESGEMIKESNALNAKDPYGLSKIEAEKIINDWCVKNRVICTILRLPLIAGANPPGNLGAMIRGISKGYYFNIAGGKAKKSIVLAKDVAIIIPVVAKIGGIYNLTDGQHPSFFELSRELSRLMNKKNSYNIPLWIAKLMAFLGDFLGKKAPVNSAKLKKITSNLTFDDETARNMIGWNPNSVLENLEIN